MLRTICVLLAALAIGMVSGYYFSFYTHTSDLPHLERSADSAIQLPDDQATTGNVATTGFATGASSHEDRQDFYRRATQADEAELVALISEVAAIPASRARRFSAQVLLSRYAEVNPRDAIEISRALQFNPSLTASLYAVWARSDKEAALDAIRNEPDAAIVKTAALFLVEELGGDSSALLDVIEALPAHVDQLSFQIDVLVARSEYDATDAISQASNFVAPRHRKRALGRIARDLASRDPQFAISAGSQIVDRESRLSFQGEVMREWAAADPAGVLDYLAAADMSGTEMQMTAGYTFSALADADPERFMAIVDQWSGSIAEQARYTAIRRWSEHDPQRALDFVADQPPGQKRDRLLNSIAQGYGKINTEAAMAWASSLQPRPRGIFRSVIAGVAAEDADRAFDLALSLDSAAAKIEAVQGVLMQSIYSDGDAEKIANRVLALDSRRIRQQSLQMFGYMWAQKDPSAAVNWLAANSDKLPKDSFQSIARQIAENDPQLAAEFTSRIPIAARAGWIQQVASGFAKSDPVSAMNWVSQYQGEPGYDAALAAIAQQSAQQDPVAAARNIEHFPDASHAAIVAGTASREWAKRDPHSAALWAANIANEQVRNIAVTNVAWQWASEDANGAAQWALSLPAGPTRDTALTSAVAGLAAQGVPDEKLLSAFSTDMARQQAVVSASYRLARVDRAAADRLIKKYVSDPTLRSQVEQNLASMIP